MKTLKRILLGLFMTLSAMIIVLPASAAVNYDGITNDVASHMTRANGLLNLLRSFGYAILVGLCKLIDGMVVACHQLLEVVDLWAYVKDVPFFSSGVGKIAVAVLALSITFAAIYLAAFSDKTSVTDTVRNILLSIVLIIALPTLVSITSSFIDIGADVVADVDTTGSDSVDIDTNSRPHSLGEQLLGSTTYIVYEDNNRPAVSTYDEHGKLWNYLSPYDIDVNHVLDNKSFTRYPSSNPFISTGGTRRFDELSIENCMTLLGLVDEYNKYLRIAGTEDTVAVFSGKVDHNGIKLYDYLNAEQMAEMLVKSIGNKCGVRLSGTNISEALTNETVEDKLIDLNYRNNLDMINKGEDILSGSAGSTDNFMLFPLRDEDDEKKAGTTELIIGTLQNGFLGYQENLYEYDVDWVMAFIIIIATAFAMAFAGFKLASTLYDRLFINTFAAIFVASDARQTGRAKKTIEQLITTSLVLVIVLIIIKVYVICVINVVKADFSFAVKLFLILGGVKFVIDGPDFLVRVIGIDAGVKSGAAAAMWIGSGARTAVGAAKAGVGLAAAGVKTTAKVADTAVAVGRGVAHAPGAVAHAAGRAAETIGNVASSVSDNLEQARQTSEERGTNRVGRAFRNAGAVIGGINSSVGLGRRYNEGRAEVRNERVRTDDALAANYSSQQSSAPVEETAQPSASVNTTQHEEGTGQSSQSSMQSPEETAEQPVNTAQTSDTASRPSGSQSHSAGAEANTLHSTATASRPSANSSRPAETSTSPSRNISKSTERPQTSARGQTSKDVSPIPSQNTSAETPERRDK